MSREIDSNFFVGDDVTNTIAKGLKTLFVVGIQDSTKIIKIATMMKCKAIYFGAEDSFHPGNWSEWDDWLVTVREALDTTKFLCTLDMDVKYAEEFHESGLDTDINFILALNLKLPYIRLFGYNTVLKIDDKAFGETNPGVWCHNLSDLTSKKAFTHWSAYNKDKTIT